MQKMRFMVERSVVGGCADAAYLGADEEPTSALREAVWDAVRLDLKVTVGDTTMPATMWEDPEHWADDWAKQLGVDHDDVAEAVAAILAAATEDD